MIKTLLNNYKLTMNQIESSHTNEDSDTNQNAVPATTSQHCDKSSQTDTTYRYYPLEPAMFLVFFAFSVSGTVLQSQIIYQTCTTHFGYNASDCSLLGKENANKDTEAIELIVQPYAAEILMAQQCVQAIVPVVMSLFIGPWSDKYGRKPVIISAMIGYFLTNSMIAITALLSTKMLLTPWLYVLAYVPMSLLGGNCAFFTGVFCYVSDTSSLKSRGMRMAVMQAALYAGLLVGLLASSYVLQMTSVLMIFMLSTAVLFLAMIYVIFFVTESVQRTDTVKGFKKFATLFDVQLVVNMFVICFKRRNNWDRAIVWTCMLSLGAILFVMEGSITIFYLYIREKFQWTIKEYTFYDAANIVAQIIGNIFGLYILRKILGLSESILAALSFFSAMCDCATKGLATQPWQMYAAIGYGLVKSISSPMIRAILANTVPTNEIGAVYSLTASIESVTPLTAAPLYSYVYSQTLKTFSGAFNFIGTGIFGCCTMGLLIIYVIQKRYPRSNYEIVAVENNE